MTEQYVDGFLLAIPSAKLDAYRAMASRAGDIWKEYGALDYRECVADDLNADPQFASFTQAARAGENDVVIFAWIVYPSKAERDRINAAVMADPRLNPEECKDVVDMARMAWGGFRTLVQA
ncbi:MULTISPECIES: DUF1428 domain-containing protein [unclassified Bordetella]|uniref:DUF1428 domain-containing protein n=1 Tax=unclassified Bordetella TaxID=2630031 RepID=UPI001322C60E|nr:MULTISPECIES: DUF1428 domain-containing protein [unclassified Bordetella]MVW69967.1 DUF1428 family protein [Bordetella sp. 15P40C-2]MVW78181.1 DUF1428 family protein [Bordetella sp. 02P26C-1]